MRKPWYLRKWVWIAAAVVMIVGIPLIINGLYLANGPIKTKWEAADVLDYYGTILSFAGTVVLGVIAVWQTQKANDLSKRMLDLEEIKYIPMVDLCQINKVPSDLPNGTYQNALKVTPDGYNLAMAEDNSILYSDADVLVFEIKNVSDTYITSLEILDLQYVAYVDGKPVQSNHSIVDRGGGIRAFSVGEAQYLLVSGVDTRFDLGDLSREEAGQCVLKLEITLRLGNTLGKVFRETIRIGYYPTREANGLRYPHVFRKEPLKTLPE